MFEKRFFSCSNLTVLKNARNTRGCEAKATQCLSVVLRRSLHKRGAEELAPLIEQASSFSSFGSSSEIAAESVVANTFSEEKVVSLNRTQLSDKVRNELHNGPCVSVPRRVGESAPAKQRPHSVALPDRSSAMLPHERNKRHSQMVDPFSPSIEISAVKNTRTNSNTPKDYFVPILRSSSQALQSKYASLDNVAIPRRKSNNRLLPASVSTTTISHVTFSKEQKRRLKQKMREKCSSGTVFLGLF